MIAVAQNHCHIRSIEQRRKLRAILMLLSVFSVALKWSSLIYSAL
jgi:hypothetical protein